MDRIQIEDLEIYARHGAYLEEQKLGQKFLICAQLFVEIQNAAAQDDLNLAVNYGEVCYFMEQWMKENTCCLLETVADRLAQDILLQFPLVQKICLEVKKPNAPIALPLSYVSVAVERQWHNVYVGVGSNLGNREEYIRQAMLLLNEYKNCQIQKGSKLYQTEPYGVTEQPEFLNGCLLVRTLQSPQQLLETLHAIEQHLGRERIFHWGPRTIDLDILLYDDLVMSTETLTIPHIDLQNRIFVLEPLDEIAGFLWHPVYKKTIHQLYQQLREK